VSKSFESAIDNLKASIQSNEELIERTERTNKTYHSAINTNNLEIEIAQQQIKEAHGAIALLEGAFDPK